MAATAIPTRAYEPPPQTGGRAAPTQTTLLELVRAVGEVTQDDREVVATIRHLLRTGRVVLCGNFRGECLDD